MGTQGFHDILRSYEEKVYLSVCQTDVTSSQTAAYLPFPPTPLILPSGYTRTRNASGTSMPQRFKAGRKARRQVQPAARKLEVVRGAHFSAETIEVAEGQEIPAIGVQRAGPILQPGTQTQKSTSMWPSYQGGKALATKWRDKQSTEPQSMLNSTKRSLSPGDDPKWQLGYLQWTNAAPGRLNVVSINEHLQKVCSIVDLVGILPLETSESMMREHQLPSKYPGGPLRNSKGRSSSAPSPVDMVWYLVADAGCSPAVSIRLVGMRYPNCPYQVLFDRVQAAQSIIRFDPYAPNQLMEEMFRRGMRYSDCEPQDALGQDWVSIVHKTGIEMNDERTCAHLSMASLCICTREERMLRQLFRGTSQLEKDGNATALAFEDENFKALKKRILGQDGQCSCPRVSVAVSGRPRHTSFASVRHQGNKERLPKLLDRQPGTAGRLVSGMPDPGSNHDKYLLDLASIDREYQGRIAEEEMKSKRGVSGQQVVSVDLQDR